MGHDDTTTRDLFVLSIAKPDDLPRGVALTSARFVCLIAWDARAADDKVIRVIAHKLLEAGAVYICAWGPDCERVHDVIDLERDQRTPTSASVVMTTWHDDETLGDAIVYVLTSTYPDEAYVAECGSTLGIAIGATEWGSEIRRAFSQPREFVRQMLQDE